MRFSNLLAAGSFTLLTLFSALNSKAQKPSGAEQLPCCTVTALDTARGLATARENSTGRTFDFVVMNQALLQSLKVGQGIYANFKTNQVSVDGISSCCRIVSPGTGNLVPIPPTIGGTSPSQTPIGQTHPAPCCQITAVDQQTAIVTAKVNATALPFAFKASNPGLLQSLKVGQEIYANFKTQQVSLDGVNPCCPIVNPGATHPASMPSIAGAPAPGQKPAAPPFGRISCCQVTNFSITDRIATAKINFSGQTFQFRVTNLPSLSQLPRAGLGVYANFKTLQVSLDGMQPSGQIVAFGPKPARMPPPITFNPPHLPPKPSRVVPTLSAQLQPHGLGQVLPLMQASGGSGVDAANALIAAPWNGGLADQYKMLAKKAFSDYVSSHLGQAGQPIASGGGTVGLDLGPVQVGADWHYTLKLVKATPYVDLSSGPPGFLYASLTGQGGNPPGFVARAPLSGSWNFGASAGVLVLDAGIDDYVGDSLDWSVPAIALTAGISNFSVTAGAQVDSSQPDRPILIKGDLSPQLTLSIAAQVVGAPANNIQIPIALTLEVQPGSVAVKGGFASAPIFPTKFNFPVNARLTGDTALTFTPKNRSGDITTTASLTGYLEVDLINPVNGQNLTTVKVDLASLSIPFDVSIQGSFLGNPFDIALLSPSVLAQLTAAFGPLPATWPPAGSTTVQISPIQNPVVKGKPQLVYSTDLKFGGVTPPPPNPLPNFADIAQQLEAAMDPRHIPYGAVLLRDSWLRLPLDSGSQISYARLADSAIFTGHYLAAESFRYAATNDPAALARVQRVLNGIQLLFDITKDAVGQNCTDHRDVRTCEFKAVPPTTAGRVLSRSVLPSNSPYPYTLDGSQGYPPDMVRLDGKTPCFYIHPEGGWAVGNRTYPTLAAVPTQQVSPGRTPASVFGPIGQIGQNLLKPLPVGTLWYGVGCGKDTDDDPVSRDSYLGTMMGLAFAYALVPPVQSQVQQMVDTALDYIVQNNWNIPTPPDGQIVTTLIGQFDMQLDFLRIGATVDPPKWGPVYQRFQSASAIAWIPDWISTLDPFYNYFNFHLGHASFSPFLFLENDPAVRQNLLAAYNIMRRATAAHRNAYFDLVRILIEPQAARSAVASGPAPSNSDIPLSAEIVSLLSEWLDRRAKVITLTPASSPFPTNIVPNPQDIEWLWNPPRHIGVYRGLNTQDCQILSTFALPVESRPGARDYLWESSPFETGVRCPDYSVSPPPQDKIDTGPFRESAAMDYLLPYWMAVYLGLLN